MGLKGTMWGASQNGKWEMFKRGTGEERTGGEGLERREDYGRRQSRKEVRMQQVGKGSGKTEVDVNGKDT